MAASTPTAAQWDLADIRQKIAASGVEAAVDDLRRTGGDEFLIAALTHAASYVENDHSQLWFQLQARTRLHGWEHFQAELLRRKPAETLVALSPGLAPARRNVVRSWRFSDSAISHIGLSGDGSHIYCGTLDGDLAVIDSATFRMVRRLREVGRVLDTANTSGGDVIIAQGYGRKGISINDGGRATAYDLRSGEKIAGLMAADPSAGYVGFARLPFIATPDRAGLLQAAKDAFWQFSLDGSQQKRALLAEATVREPIFMQFISDGTQLLVGTAHGNLHAFDWPQFKQSEPAQSIGTRVTDFALSDDESLVAVTSAYVQDGGKTRFGSLVLWDRLAGRELARISSATEPLLCTTFLPGGQRVVTGGFLGNVAIWNHTSEPIKTFPLHDAPIVSLLALPNGKHLVSADAHGFVKIVALAAEIPEPEPLPRPTAVLRRAISPDGTWEADYSTDKLNIRPAGGGPLLHVIRLDDALVKRFGELKSAALNPQGATATLGGMNAVLHWNLQDNSHKLVTIRPDPSALPQPSSGRNKAPDAFPVSISPDGRHAFVVWNSAILEFDPLTGDQRYAKLYPVRQFSQDHACLSGERVAIPYQAISKESGRFEGILIIDLRTGAVLDDVVHGASRIGFAYARRSDRLALSGRWQHDSPQAGATIWNAEDGTRHSLNFGERQHRVFGITDDGSQLLTLYGDPTTVYVWDLATQEIVHRFDVGIHIVSATYDGRTLMLGDRAQTTYLFEYQR